MILGKAEDVVSQYGFGL